MFQYLDIYNNEHFPNRILLHQILPQAFDISPLSFLYILSTKSDSVGQSLNGLSIKKILKLACIVLSRNFARSQYSIVIYYDAKCIYPFEWPKVTYSNTSTSTKGIWY